jgi:hypothetical protein
MCIWRDVPQQKTQGHYTAGAPPILYVPMFPWKYVFSRKQERNKEIKKRVHTRLDFNDKYLFSIYLSN